MDDLEVFVVRGRCEFIDLGVVPTLFAAAFEDCTVGGIHMLMS
jgi:hypothetical protein